MPPAVHADVCPDDHDTHHRRHPISSYHTPRDRCSDDQCPIHNDPDGPDQHDEPADVTVSDLLDAYDNVRPDEPLGYAELGRAALRADGDALASAQRIGAALLSYRRLSPEERAEFDRRTT